MASGDFWSGSQREAWGYVQSFVEQGYNQSQALKAYREGGGAIRTQLWGDLWHRFNEGQDQWGSLYQYKTSDTLSESLFTPTDVNYRNKYNVTYRADITDSEGNVTYGKWFTVSSNRRVTLGELNDAMKEIAIEYPGYEEGKATNIRSIHFYSPMSR